MNEELILEYKRKVLSDKIRNGGIDVMDFEVCGMFRTICGTPYKLDFISTIIDTLFDVDSHDDLVELYNRAGKLMNERTGGEYLNYGFEDRCKGI